VQCDGAGDACAEAAREDVRADLFMLEVVVKEVVTLVVLFEQQVADVVKEDGHEKMIGCPVFVRKRCALQSVLELGDGMVVASRLSGTE
jgi:hypothetical protein